MKNKEDVYNLSLAQPPQHAPPPPRLIKNFEEYDEFIDKRRRMDFTGSVKEFYRGYKLDFDSFVQLFGTSPPDCDPFSKEYLDWEISFLEFISGKKYSFDNEGCGISNRLNAIPTSYGGIDEKVRKMRQYADLLEIVKPKANECVIEMGFGWGVTLELFGRCGCHVFGVEASRSYVQYSERILRNQGINANVLHGSFYDIEQFAEEFDIVLFEASFHHCAEAERLLELLHKKTKHNGRIYLISEPINNNMARPWGLRLDGESIWQIRDKGWMELGYRLDFFVELLARTGWNLSKTHKVHAAELHEVVKH